ncbi:DUF3667 domain-containing protein [Hymenobacter guriensis]|uniref:DUF3667 domain-containing protein n=1 Tax=Hymenobacter guriensis TaxID=2793065 RepID=A0ABS0KWF5_9BACT|nr:DUF3667 domain-containing protein [Hymenobacter guriensis]MBG8552168.1 DUF3667 domain-containing protein [Hymenobacter guriensis]
MTDASSLCLNCDQPLTAGTYCAHCGQPRPHRLSVGHVLHELVHVFTHADKSIFGYAALVLTRPGQVVRDYLRSRRKRYFNPFQFLLLTVGFVTLLANALHYYDSLGEAVQQQIGSRVSATQLQHVQTYFHALGKYFNIWWLALLPPHALLMWLVYRRRGLNYAEAFLVQVVISSAYQVLLLGLLPLLTVVPWRVPGSSTALLGGIITVVYLTLVGRQGFGLSWAGAFGRALLTGILYIIIDFLLNYLVFHWYVFG